MYVNPRYRELTGVEPPTMATAEAPDREAPEEQGVRLATLPRSDRDGAEEELRVTLSEYQTHQYISLRVWSRDARSGAYWPVKGKGVTVRLREAEDVAEALKAGLRLSDRKATQAPRARAGAAGRPGQGRPDREPRARAASPELPEPRGGGFSEFDE